MRRLSAVKRSWCGRAAAVLALVMVICCSFAPSCLSAPETQENYEIDTKAFDVDVAVQEDNSFLITETIRVFYNEPRHGMVRYIPYTGLAYYGEKGDIVERPYRAKITDISVDGYPFELFTESTDGDTPTRYQLIQIGDRNTMVQGEQTYRISYRYALYDDRDESMDMVYLNLVPFAWISPVESAKISVRFPKEFEVSYINFLSGEFGDQDATAVDFDFRDNIITAETNRPLAMREGITLRVDLPEGYFSKGSRGYFSWLPNIGGPYLGMLAASILAAVICFVLWFLFGRDKKVIPTVEFYPPEGMNPAEVGYVVDGIVDNKDLIALIIYWADKGYLSIEQPTKKEFVFHKLRELDSNARPYEKTLFDGLFENGRDSVALSELKGTFYLTLRTAWAQLTAYMETSEEKLAFTKASTVAQLVSMLLTIVPLTVTSMLTAYLNIRNAQVHYIASAIFALFLLITTWIFKRLADRHHAYKKGKRVLGWILNTLLCVAAISALYVTTIDDQPLYKNIALAATVIALVCTIFLHRRTDSGVRRLGKILGLKRFIEEVEADRIRMLAEENPDYFYSVLPYAYVLDVSNVWAKNFEEIAVEPPRWLDDGRVGQPAFNTMIFINTFNTFRSEAAAQLAFKPPQQQFSGGSSGAGGGIAGGGFSGGGFGGGGGKSW